MTSFGNYPPDQRPPHHGRMQALWREMQTWDPSERLSMALGLVHLGMLDADSDLVDLGHVDPVAGYPIYVLAARRGAVAKLQTLAAWYLGTSAGPVRQQQLKQGEGPHARPGVVGESQTLRACLLCGCTDDRACEGGCCWVLPALCSACLLNAVAAAAAGLIRPDRERLAGELAQLAAAVADYEGNEDAGRLWRPGDPV
jgi:hypothetical protein